VSSSFRSVQGPVRTGCHTSNCVGRPCIARSHQYSARTVVPQIFRHSGGINSDRHMREVEKIPMTANQRTRTHSKIREPSATKARDDRIWAIRRSRATGHDSGQAPFQNFATIKARPRPEKAQNRRACRQCCTRGGGTDGCLTRGVDNSSLPRTLASIVAPVSACHWPVELTENFF